MARHYRAPLGQVFLTDPSVIRRIMSALRVQLDDAMLEIGAGPGTMTELLAERAAKVWAVEVDGKLAAGLRKKFADSPTVEVVEADILKVSIDALCSAAGRERSQAPASCAPRPSSSTGASPRSIPCSRS